MRVQGGDDFSWLSCIFLLAELVAGQGEIISSCWSSKIGFFLLGMQGKSLPAGDLQFMMSGRG